MTKPESAAHSLLVEPDRRKMLVAQSARAAVPFVAGCAAPEPGAAQRAGESLDEPGFSPPPPGTQCRVAFVLSGGAARGFAHIGVLRVLKREGWWSDLVVGTGADAIVGAMYASGLSVANIETGAATLDWSVLFDFDPIRSLLGGIGQGVVPGERLDNFLRQHIPISIERFPVPLRGGRCRHGARRGRRAESGDAARAVPGLYAPVRARGRLLAAGQVVNPLPVLAARSLDAVRVLAVDVVYPPQHSEISNPISMLFQSMIVSGWRHALADTCHHPGNPHTFAARSGEPRLGDRSGRALGQRTVARNSCALRAHVGRARRSESLEGRCQGETHMHIAGRWVSLEVANTIFILWAVAVAVLGVVVWWLSRRSPPKNPAKGKGCPA